MLERIEYLIDRFKLQAHPEGGFYVPAFRSNQVISTDNLNGTWKGNRTLYSSILFLLTNDTFSAWHKIASDEIWHHYEVDDIHIHILHPDGSYTLEVLSKENGKENFTAIVHGGSWFASESVGNSGYALAGCTLAPGFDFDDFELGSAEKLCLLFPYHKKLIDQYAR